MYDIGNTVFAATDNHPMANCKKHWVGVVKDFVIRNHTYAYKCTTVYSDEKGDIGKEALVRHDYLSRYALQSGDTVTPLEGAGAGKVGVVGERTATYRVNVKFEDGSIAEYAVRALKLVKPIFAPQGEEDILPVGTKVVANGEFVGSLPRGVAAGTKGVIVISAAGGDSQNYGISWEGCTTGHACNGAVADEHSGWFSYRRTFDVVEKAAVAEPPKPVNNTPFLVGDVVRRKMSRDSAAMYIGEVVAINGTTLYLKSHDMRYVKKNRDGKLVANDNAWYDDNKTFEEYLKLPYTNLVLLRRNNENVFHDVFSGEEITSERHDLIDGAIYDKTLNMVFPAYLSAESYAEMAYTCSRCGKEHLKSYSTPHSVITADGSTVTYCGDCTGRYTTTCSHCGRVYESREVGGFAEVHCGSEDDDDYIEMWCHSCVDMDAAYCEEHGITYDERYGCPTCNSRGKIHSYGYKPDPTFFAIDGEETDRNKTLYYGVEDETEGSGRNPTNFAHALGSSVHEVYCKHDGSLDNGAEVVTHPCTVRYHVESDMWERVSDAGRGNSMKSHDTTTCGLHVHISRAPFITAGVTDYEDKITLAFDRFKAYWKAISRRREGNCRWAAFLSDKRREKTNTKLEEVKAKKDRYDRYQAVNLCNDKTVEVRIFRGTLKVSTIKATLWLVDATCRFILNGGDVETCRFSELIDLANAPDFVKEYLFAREVPIV